MPADTKESDTAMAAMKQSRAAKRNMKKAVRAGRRKWTIAHLPKSARTALGKRAAKVRNCAMRRA